MLCGNCSLIMKFAIFMQTKIYFHITNTSNRNFYGKIFSAELVCRRKSIVQLLALVCSIIIACTLLQMDCLTGYRKDLLIKVPAEEITFCFFEHFRFGFAFLLCKFSLRNIFLDTLPLSQIRNFISLEEMFCDILDSTLGMGILGNSKSGDQICHICKPGKISVFDGSTDNNNCLI